MILALTLAMVGGPEIAAAAPSPSLQSPATQSIAFQNAVAEVKAGAGAIVQAVSFKARCKGHSHRASGVCSLDALQILSETVAPSQSFRAVTWLVGDGHLDRTSLDPGFRPPIPVS